MSPRYTRHVSAISGYPIFIDFRRLTGCLQDPQVLGCHINNEKIIIIRVCYMYKVIILSGQIY